MFQEPSSLPSSPRKEPMALLCIIVIGAIVYYKLTHPSRRGIQISPKNVQPIASMPFQLARAQQRRKELS